tara:strand:- start:182 stop:325 length:144 start_codon:yes stop_codon:yes gene_type:complete
MILRVLTLLFICFFVFTGVNASEIKYQQMIYADEKTKSADDEEPDCE